ncbi:uncharacterized protein M8220_005697 isoform 2-T2 [Acridotheres tristis]
MAARPRREGMEERLCFTNLPGAVCPRAPAGLLEAASWAGKMFRQGLQEGETGQERWRGDNAWKRRIGMSGVHSGVFFLKPQPFASRPLQLELDVRGHTVSSTFGESIEGLREWICTQSHVPSTRIIL